MKKQNKYKYLYVVQGNYGYGWDDLTSSEDRKEALKDYHDYQKNEMYAHRIIQRRELNEVC